MEPEEDTPLTLEDLTIEPEPRMTLIEAIDLGRAHAVTLSVAGATEGIRYAAKRAAEMSFRLMRELETHRRYTGGEHA